MYTKVMLLFSNLVMALWGIAQVPTHLLPKSETGVQYHQQYYSYAYAEDLEQSIWVAYSLSPEVKLGRSSRSDNFRIDTKVKTGSATLLDYKGSGYDRGHLAPAADMSFDKIAMSQSFLMSNMSPQVPSFNRGIWKNLESLVRRWGNELENIYIITGPAIIDKSIEIGSNKVDVPSHYYKIILESDLSIMTGFLFPNKKCEGELYQYIIPVDSIEQITGIDFFPELDDAIEKKLEMTSGYIPQFSNKKIQSSQTKEIQVKSININHATLPELITLPYIGEVKAKAIILARPFAKKEDILKVKGIGATILSKIESLITT